MKSCLAQSKCCVKNIRIHSCFLLLHFCEDTKSYKFVVHLQVVKEKFSPSQKVKVNVALYDVREKNRRMNCMSYCIILPIFSSKMRPISVPQHSAVSTTHAPMYTHTCITVSTTMFSDTHTHQSTRMQIQKR